MIRIEITAAAYAALCEGVPPERLLDALPSPSGGFYLLLDNDPGQIQPGPWARRKLFRRHFAVVDRGGGLSELCTRQARWETLKALAVLLSTMTAMAALILTVAHFIK